jgi:hypothetical protein
VTDKPTAPPQVSPPFAAGGFRYPPKPGLPPIPQNDPPPSYKTFFNPVWLELMDLPPLSDKVLSRSLSGVEMKAKGPAAGPVAIIKATLPIRLQPAFQPPAATQYVALPMENKCCDVIRARYLVKPFVVDLGFAKRLFAVRLVGPVRNSGEQPLQAANRLLRLVMDETSPPATPVHLIQINDTDGSAADAPAYGCHDTSVVRYSPGLPNVPHWADMLCWWLRPDEFGVISFRGFGDVSMGVETAEVDQNTYWFTPPP